MDRVKMESTDKLTAQQEGINTTMKVSILTQLASNKSEELAFHIVGSYLGYCTANVRVPSLSGLVFHSVKDIADNFDELRMINEQYTGYQLRILGLAKVEMEAIAARCQFPGHPDTRGSSGGGGGGGGGSGSKAGGGGATASNAAACRDIPIPRMANPKPPSTEAEPKPEYIPTIPIGDLS